MMSYLLRQLVREHLIILSENAVESDSVPYEDEFGRKTEYKNKQGQLHRGNDLPAVITFDGKQEWWVNGKRHRENDQPAIIQTGRRGSHYSRKEWWVDGKQHREGGLPAVIWGDGRKEWWVHGELHREGNKPAIVYGPERFNSKEYWVHGKRHRDNGPAIDKTYSNISDDPGLSYEKKWFINGKEIEPPNEPFKKR